MAISKEDRERFEAQACDLEKIETDDPGTVGRRRSLMRIGNYLRESAGIEPLPYEEGAEEEFPELGFFRRAEALGMARIRRS